MQSTTTRVPAFLDALDTRLRATLVADDWQVYDGPPADPNLDGDVFVFGIPDESGSAVTVSSERADGLDIRYDETLTVRCVLSHLTGDVDDMSGARTRVKSGVDIIDTALRQDRGIGGVVDLTHLGDEEDWRQAQTQDGLAVECAFTIVAKVLGR